MYATARVLNKVLTTEKSSGDCQVTLMGTKQSSSQLINFVLLDSVAEKKDE